MVGSPGDDDEGNDVGSAYVFERSGDAWIQTARLVSRPFIETGSRLGEAVATDGARIIAGAPAQSVGGLTGAGVAYVFERDSGDRWALATRLMPLDIETGSHGRSVDIEGDLAVVGTTTGTAHIYRRASGGCWAEDERLAGIVDSDFGFRVAIEQGEVFVSAPLGDSAGVFRYAETADGWEVVQTLPAPSPGFGEALAASPGQLVVARPGTSNETGRVYVFEREGEDFVLAATLESELQAFGVQVASGQDMVAVGAMARAFVYQRTGSLWVPTELVGSGGPFTGVVPAVSASESVLLGYSGESVGGPNAGVAYVFDPPPPSAFQPFGFGDGSTVPCPCGNDSAPGAGEGCANSTGVGARLRISGSASMAADAMLVTADQIPAGKSTQLFIGRNRLIGLPFGDGLRIATVPFIRIPVRQASATGEIDWTGLHATGFWEPGDVRYFQAFYRDPQGPCGSGFNVTNPVQVVFEP